MMAYMIVEMPAEETRAMSVRARGDLESYPSPCHCFVDNHRETAHQHREWFGRSDVCAW